MPRIVRYGVGLLLGAAGSVVILTLLLPFWLLPVVQWLLPQGVSLNAESRPQLSWTQLSLSDIRLQGPDCQMAQAKQLRLGYADARFNIDAESLALNSACLARWPTKSQQTADASMTLSGIQHWVPALRIGIKQLQLDHWSNYSGQLDFLSRGRQQQLNFQGQALHLAATLNNQQLTIRSLQLGSALLSQPLKLTGQITLADKLQEIPSQASLQGTLALPQSPNPLGVHLIWQGEQGQLTLSDSQQPQQPLLDLPWQFDKQQIQVQQGRWRWPQGAQPAAGNLSFTLSQWQQGLEQIRWQGRLNAVTQGRGGKGNIVVNFGPGKLSLLQSQLPIRIYGEAKLAQLQFYAGLPGEIEGSLIDPQLRFRPGALLRIRGQLLPGWQVDEARLPLSGVSLGLQGVNGPLQGNFWIRNLPASFYRLYLRGQAKDFLFKQGRWDWNYWGEGKLLPLHAQWHIKGEGNWQDEIITLSSLTTGFDQIRYGKTLIREPRMILTRPFIWSIAEQQPHFSGAVRVNAEQTHFGDTSRLPAAELTLSLAGRTPSEFNFMGQMIAKPIGPVQVIGRRNEDHWLGRARWPEQPLQVFQPLLGPKEKMALSDGKMRAQAAFSISPQRGFQAGGHWRVEQGSLLLPSLKLNGIDFSLPFRFFDHDWHFGWHAPAAIHIAKLESQFTMHDFKAQLRGAWPWRRQDPLTLSAVSLKLFNGEVRLPELRVPQRQPARLQFSHIDTQNLLDTFYSGKLKLTGSLSGELPIWFEPTGWRISDGWLSNDQPLRLEVSKQQLAGWISNPILTSTAHDWLSPLILTRSAAKIAVDTQGKMQLTGKISAQSEIDKRQQRLEINYQQQENILQLWRSLNFGDTLQTRLEEQLQPPTAKESK